MCKQQEEVKAKRDNRDSRTREAFRKTRWVAAITAVVLFALLWLHDLKRVQYDQATARRDAVGYLVYMKKNGARYTPDFSRSPYDLLKEGKASAEGEMIGNRMVTFGDHTSAGFIRFVRETDFLLYLAKADHMRATDPQQVEKAKAAAQLPTGVHPWLQAQFSSDGRAHLLYRTILFVVRISCAFFSALFLLTLLIPLKKSGEDIEGNEGIIKEIMELLAGPGIAKAMVGGAAVAVVAGGTFAGIISLQAPALKLSADPVTGTVIHKYETPPSPPAPPPQTITFVTNPKTIDVPVVLKPDTLMVKWDDASRDKMNEAVKTLQATVAAVKDTLR